MAKYRNRLICFIKGHKWSFWGLFDSDRSCQFEKCMRCGKYKGDGEQVRNEYCQDF